MTTYNIIKNVSLHEIHDMFKRADRDNFSYEALGLIMDNEEENSANDTGGHTNAIDLDIIAICCDWAESKIEDYINDYQIDIEEVQDDFGEIDSDLLLEYAQEDTTAYLTQDGTHILYINH